MVEIPNSDVLYQDACTIIEQAQVSAYRAVNETLIKRNWLLGMRIQYEVLKDKRAEYGEQIIENLAKRLTIRYEKGLIKRNLHHFVDFFVKYPDFFHTVSGKSDIIPSLMGQSDNSKIVNAVSSQLPATIINIVNAVNSQSSMEAMFQTLIGKSPIRLSWTHYRVILQENSKEACDTCVLVLPCGRSAHTEAGWFAGRGKTIIAYIPERQEPELMYKLFTKVCCSTDELIEALK